MRSRDLHVDTASYWARIHRQLISKEAKYSRRVEPTVTARE